MDMIIEKLMQIEMSARTIVDEAIAQKERLKERISEKSGEIAAEAEAKAGAVIADAREKADAEAEEQILRINERAARWASSLEEQYERNRDTWVKEIFRAVTATQNR